MTRDPHRAHILYEGAGSHCCAVCDIFALDFHLITSFARVPLQEELRFAIIFVIKLFMCLFVVAWTLFLLTGTSLCAYFG